MNDCRQCEHGQLIRHGFRFCSVMYPPRLVEQMRDDRSECGLKGELFEQVMKDMRYQDV